MVVETARDRLAVLAIAAELAQLAVGPRRAGVVADVQARQRPDPIHALRIAQRLVVRELEVGPRLHSLADEALKSAGSAFSSTRPSSSTTRSRPS